MQTKKAKLFVAAFALLCSLLLVSCTKNADEFHPPAFIEKSTPVSGKEAAAVYYSQQTWEVDRIMNVPCANNGNGEDVQLTSYVHFTDHFTVNGNRFTLVSKANYSGVSGTGLLTGDKYVANGGGSFTLQGELENGQFIASGTDRVNIIGQGPNNNSIAVFKGRVIVNANGTVTHQLLDIKIECK